MGELLRRTLHVLTIPGVIAAAWVAADERRDRDEPAGVSEAHHQTLPATTEFEAMAARIREAEQGAAEKADEDADTDGFSESDRIAATDPS